MWPWPKFLPFTVQSLPPHRLKPEDEPARIAELELIAESLSLERMCLGLDRHRHRYWLLGTAGAGEGEAGEAAIFVQRSAPSDTGACVVGMHMCALAR